MKNWKTTLAGVSMLLSGIVLIVSEKNYASGVTAIIAGIGLVFAKDGNVTGGTTPQTTEAENRTIK